ncbi:hypothetical protein TA3x_000490 [Tundrisphaera sp. TA3]|uniref:hypothetical protein n=1 Tax=Tundrisphaera sp. TA3 TaxID=3435775 RepID=UPI003EBAA709
MQAAIIKHIYIKCPACGISEYRVCHLFGGRIPYNFGPWHCDDCGAVFTGRINSPNDIELEVDDSQRDIPVFDVLVMPPQQHPLYLIVKAMAYGGDVKSKQFLYEEHTCPINWTRDILKLVIEGDNDPHGLFEYIKTVNADAGIVELPDGTKVELED